MLSARPIAHSVCKTGAWRENEKRAVQTIWRAKGMPVLKAAVRNAIRAPAMARDNDPSTRGRIGGRAGTHREKRQQYPRDNENAGDKNSCWEVARQHRRRRPARQSASSSAMLCGASGARRRWRLRRERASSPRVK